MQVRLVPERGAAADGAISLRKEESLIGRAKGSDVRIPSSEVSRRHCLLNSSAGYVTVEDLGSSNGTLVNDEPIDGRQILRPGDRLQVGPVCFVVEYKLSAEGLERMLADEAAGVEVVEEPESVEEVVAEDGEVETVEVVENLDEPIPVIGADDEDKPAARVEDDDSIEEEGEPVSDEEPPHAAFSFEKSEQLQMPEGGDIRDILSELEGPGAKNHPEQLDE